MFDLLVPLPIRPFPSPNRKSKFPIREICEESAVSWSNGYVHADHQ